MEQVAALPGVSKACLLNCLMWVFGDGVRFARLDSAGFNAEAVNCVTQMNERTPGTAEDAWVLASWYAVCPSMSRCMYMSSCIHVCTKLQV